MVWYQKFEYAVGHWLQKTAEHVLGCVLCSPGCFSLFRGAALMDDNVMKKYTITATEAGHYVQYDQGTNITKITLFVRTNNNRNDLGEQSNSIQYRCLSVYLYNVTTYRCLMFLLPLTFLPASPPISKPYLLHSFPPPPPLLSRSPLPLLFLSLHRPPPLSCFSSPPPPGEDRWLCTLLLQQGWRVEYNAASDAYTNAPQDFKEFYNQVRVGLSSRTAK